MMPLTLHHHLHFFIENSSQPTVTQIQTIRMKGPPIGPPILPISLFFLFASHLAVDHGRDPGKPHRA